MYVKQIEKGYNILTSNIDIKFIYKFTTSLKNIKVQFLEINFN